MRELAKRALGTSKDSDSILAALCDPATVETLLAVDSSAKVEIAFFRGMAGVKGATILQSQVMNSCLPKPGNILTPTASKNALQNLMRSDLFSFVSKGTREEIEHVRDMVVAVQKGRPPSTGNATEGFRGDSVKALDYFVEAEIKDEDQPMVMIYGTAALAEHEKTLRAKISKNKKGLTYDDLAPFKIHRRIVSKAVEAELDGWENDIRKQLAGASAAKVLVFY